jgi:preprotein translocase subunit SecB
LLARIFRDSQRAIAPCRALSTPLKEFPMSDQPPASHGNGGAPGPAQPQTPQPGQIPIAVKTQYIKDLSFENPRAPASFQALQSPPTIDVTVNVGAQHLAEQDYEVTLVISASAKMGSEPLFMVELTYGGVVTLGQVPQEHMRPLLLIEAPRLLFPFARNIVADATREGGFPPLLLQPIDFVELYRRELAQQQQSRSA